MHPVTSVLFLPVFVAGLLTASCGKKAAPPATIDLAPSPAGKQEPKASASAAREEPANAVATGAELPKVLPPQAMLPAKPPLKAWSLRNHGEKDSQIRHWLARAEYGTPAERAQIIAAIRAAGLNANDREELEDIRSRYGYRRLQY